MENLISMIGAMIVIIAYFLGVLTGSHFSCPGRERKTGRGGIGDGTVNSGGNGAVYGTGTRTGPRTGPRTGTRALDGAVNGTGPFDMAGRTEAAENAMEEARLAKEYLKALEQCMSYSSDMAYGLI